MKPRVLQEPASIKIPPQIDFKIPLNLAVVQVGDGVKQSLQTMLLSSFFAQFFLSLSMKKLLEATRYLQIVSFFILIQINFTPVSFVFMTKIYEYSTFKVLPPAVVDWFLIEIGIYKAAFQKKQLIISVDNEIEDNEPENLKNSFVNQITKMDSLALGAAALIGFIILIIFLLYFCRKSKKCTKIIKRKFLPLMFGGIHASFKTAMLPVMIV